MDDEQLVLTSLSLLLETMGHSVVQAKSGDEVLALARRGECCDIAILDLMIQNGLGGEDIVSELRQKCPNLKIVLSSGFAEDRVLNCLRESGFHDKLLKPFSMSDLLSLFERLAPA